MSLRREILKKVTAVPPLPEVVMKLREYCNDDNVGYGTIAQVVERDASLTTSLLRLANSAYFGGTGSISSVQLAMTRLGLKRVYQMAMTVSVAPMTNVELKGYGMTPKQLWEHSLATAMTAELLAERVAGVDPADAYTSGLLHDMGKVVLSSFVGVDLAAITTLVKEKDLAFDEAEQEVLGISHASIASALLKRWQIPPPVNEAVGWHHQPSQCVGCSRLVDIVHVADALCMSIGWGGGADALHYRLDEDAPARLGVDMALGQEIVARVMMEINEMVEQFGVPQEA